jgi:hypothetical protein
MSAVEHNDILASQLQLHADQDVQVRHLPGTLVVGVHLTSHLRCQQLVLPPTISLFDLTGRRPPRTDLNHPSTTGWMHYRSPLQRDPNQCQLLKTNAFPNCARSQVITLSFSKELVVYLFEPDGALNPPMAHLPCLPPIHPLSPPILRSTSITNSHHLLDRT